MVLASAAEAARKRRKTMKALLTLTAILSAIAIAAPAASPFITDTLGGNGHATQTYRFITDTLGGNGKPKAIPDVFERAVARHAAQPTQTQGVHFITDTLAPGGGTSLAAKPSPSRFSWADAGVGAGVVAGALTMLAGGLLLVRRRDTILA
jgi:hypothetical protein